MNKTEAVRAGREEAKARSSAVPGIRSRELTDFGCSVVTKIWPVDGMLGLTIMSRALLAGAYSGHPAVRPASGCSAGWAMPCSSLSHRQSPAGPASQPPALRKLLPGGWEVKEWRWDREEQKREEQETKSEGGDGCCS